MISYLPYIFIGGGIGATARYLISILLSSITLSWVGTLVANLLGCFIFFLFHRYIVAPQKELSLFVLTGMMGGLTTFSTFSYEVVNSLKLGNYSQAVAILLLNLVISFSAGIWILKGH